MDEITRTEAKIGSGGMAIQLYRELTPAIWEMIAHMAPVMYQSRLFGMTSQDAAAAIMLKGYELGLSITASFEFVQVIKGKPGLSPRGALALLHNSKVMESITITRLEKGGNFLGYECKMKRRGGFEYISTFTMEDAKRAGLVKPDSGWVTYPENMCLWRAVGFAADVVAPDITAGMTTIMKMPEAYDVALSQEGDIIPPAKEKTSEPIDVVSTPITPITEPYTGPSLNELIDEFGPSKIMEALREVTGGQLPSSDEEIKKLAEKLHD